jgi:hypothetical protein
VKENTHPLKAPIGDLGLEVLGQKWNVDIHGSFSRTSSNNAYVLMFVELVSLLTEFYPLTEITAEAMHSKAFLDCVVSRFGAVKQLCLISDRGSAFTSQFMQMFSKTYRVTQTSTARYKHDQNQPAKSIGTTINRSLRILCAEHQEYYKILPFVAMSYRSTPTAGRNLGPFQIRVCATNAC